MADLGETSRPTPEGTSTAHTHRMSSWVTVGLLILAAVLLAFAFVARSIPLAVVGLIAGIAGVVLAVTGRIMDDAY